MSWGHAVSKDLVHWEELGGDPAHSFLKWVFPGSAVIDTTQNTLRPGQPRTTRPWSGVDAGRCRCVNQSQSLALPTDKWPHLEGDEQRGPVLDIGSTSSATRRSSGTRRVRPLDHGGSPRHRAPHHLFTPPRPHPLTEQSSFGVGEGITLAVGGPWLPRRFVDGNSKEVKWVPVVTVRIAPVLLQAAGTAPPSPPQ